MLGNGARDFVFKTLRRMAEIANQMDCSAEGDNLLKNEPAYFDAAHMHVQGFKSFAHSLGEIHPLRRSGSRILVRRAQRSFDPRGRPEPKICSQ